jgi:glycosyltransferase involved in cell wall biosynthesis
MVAHTRRRADKDIIAEQLFLSRADVIMGGGSAYFLPQKTPGSKRKDDNDFVDLFARDGFRIATTDAEMKAAAANPAIVCTGAVPGTAVHQLLSHAGLFVLPSSHEGLPIALLEAVRLQVPALASDIPGNREVGLDPGAYFGVGDTVALAAKLERLASSEAERQQILQNYPAICARYNWDEIAAATLALMEEAARKQRSVRD